MGGSDIGGSLGPQKMALFSISQWFRLQGKRQVDSCRGGALVWQGPVAGNHEAEVGNPLKWINI